MKYVIGIDIGTSGTKTLLVSQAGKIVASASAEYPLYQPQNGWAEQDPNHWWQATCTTIQSVLVQSGIMPEEIEGIGLSGQMHGLVMLDVNGEVIRHAILWCDQRTAQECADINGLVGEQRHVEIAANPPLTGFTSPKILWVRKHEPEHYAKCHKILLPKDYIRYKLTGEFATEVSDASGMGLLDVKGRCWSEEILEKLDININLLGKMHESVEITGRVTQQASQQTGLAEGTLVAGGAGDNAAAAVGTGIVKDGRAFTTIGTSGVVYAHTSTPVIESKGRIHTFCSAVPGEWHVMGVTQGAGLSLRWLRDTVCTEEAAEANMQGTDPYDVMAKEAETAPIGAESLVFLPYLMGERTPHLNPNARGVFFGLSPVHHRSHMIRSVMEGVSYSLMDCLALLKEMDIVCNDMTICGGGGRSAFWCQMLADIFGSPVKTLQSAEGPALGVAILAGVGAGWFQTVEEGCQQFLATKKSYEPQNENKPAYDKYYDIYKNLYKDLATRFNDL